MSPVLFEQPGALLQERDHLARLPDRLVVAPSASKQDGTIRVEFELTNVGTRPGTEVVQIYVRPPRGPKSVLRAFRRVALEAGKKARLSIDLDVADLAHYDAKSNRYVVDPGDYELMIGASATDIRQRAPLEIGSR